MSESASPTPAEIARTNMVESQLRPNRVHNADLLAAMLNVPREAFLPDHLKSIAYADEAVKLPSGRYLTEPLITARLIDFADIEHLHRILVLGGVASYVAAITSRLAGHVVALEDNEQLRDIGSRALAALGIQNVTLTGGTLVDGCADEGPYDIIIIDGSVAEVPKAILSQLGPEGRLIAVIASGKGESHGVIIERVGAILSHRVVFDGFSPCLPGFEAKPQFEFS